MKKHIAGLLMALGATLIWASVYPIGRVVFGSAVDNVDPYSLNFLRFFSASLFFVPMLLKREYRAEVREICGRHWWKMLFLALTGGAAEGVLMMAALKYTTSARTALMVNFAPVPTLLISVLAGRELLRGNKVLGMIAGTAGVLLAFSADGSDQFSVGSAGFIMGDLLALVSGISWALFTVFGGDLSSHYNSMLCSGLICFFSALMIVPCIFVFGSGAALPLAWQTWAAATYIGVFSSGIAFALWYKALKLLSPGEVGSFGFISAMLGFSGSILLLGERCDWKLPLAMLLMLGGSAIMVMQVDKAKSPAAENAAPAGESE